MKLLLCWSLCINFLFWRIMVNFLFFRNCLSFLFILFLNVLGVVIGVVEGLRCKKLFGNLLSNGGFYVEYGVVGKGWDDGLEIERDLFFFGV